MSFLSSFKEVREGKHKSAKTYGWGAGLLLAGFGLQVMTFPSHPGAISEVLNVFGMLAVLALVVIFFFYWAFAQAGEEERAKAAADTYNLERQKSMS